MSDWILFVGNISNHAWSDLFVFLSVCGQKLNVFSDSRRLIKKCNQKLFYLAVNLSSDVTMKGSRESRWREASPLPLRYRAPVYNDKQSFHYEDSDVTHRSVAFIFHLIHTNSFSFPYSPRYCSWWNDVYRDDTVPWSNSRYYLF